MKKKITKNNMEKEYIDLLNKEKEEKEIFCELNQYLFDGDLMRGVVGESFRNISISSLC